VPRFQSRNGGLNSTPSGNALRSSDVASLPHPHQKTHILDALLAATGVLDADSASDDSRTLLMLGDGIPDPVAPSSPATSQDA
jgi:hypothetical protein